MISLKEFNKMCTAVNTLYCSRKADKGALDEDHKVALAKACQRVVYIVYSTSLDNSLAECTKEELDVLTNNWSNL